MRPWKWFTALWMTVVIIAGFLIQIPDIPILEQSARNLFLHVPMWFTMMVCFLFSFGYSIRYLGSGETEWDLKAVSATSVGLAFGICGLLTGSVWARFTWGTWWTFAEPRMNLAAMSMMIFVAYFVLRSAFEDPRRRARISAIYNIFGVTTVPFLLYIIPRQLPSLHPGADGNPAFSDITAPELRYIFYPAVIGFIALSFWLRDVTERAGRIELAKEDQTPTR